MLGGAYGDSRDTHGQALGLGDVTPTSLGHTTVGKFFSKVPVNTYFPTLRAKRQS